MKTFFFNLKLFFIFQNKQKKNEKMSYSLEKSKKIILIFYIFSFLICGLVIFLGISSVVLQSKCILHADSKKSINLLIQIGSYCFLVYAGVIVLPTTVIELVKDYKKYRKLD